MNRSNLTRNKRKIIMITRRSALLGTAAAALAPALAGHAAAPVSGHQAPAFYRFKVGDMEITAISDGYGAFPRIDGFVKNADAKDVAAALGEAYLPTGVVRIPFTTLVVNTAGKLVLLDVGNGDMAAPTSGTWMANFRAAGFTPDMVDMIVISHMHGDHINGLRLKDGTAVFPKAEIKVGAVEAAFWFNADNAAKASAGMMKTNFDNAARVFAPIAKDLSHYAWDKEVAPGITAIGAPGHTPGHTMFAIASGKDNFLAVSDITNIPALFVRHPDWAVLFDTDADVARATRHKVLDMVAAEKMHVGFYHADFPANGYIERNGSGYNLIPAPWVMPV